MSTTTIERRQFRRADVEVSVEIRPSTPRDGGSAALIRGTARDVSLAGVYCYVEAPCPLQAEDTITCFVTIPPAQARVFPFTRLVGRGWVVRQDPVAESRRAGDLHAGKPIVGLAIAFAPDVTALGTIENT